jgi:hypothetical protein
MTERKSLVSERAELARRRSYSRPPTDLEVARAIHYNKCLREEANPERDPDSDADAFIASLLDEEPEVDQTWDYMIDLLDSGEIDFAEFRRQMLSVGYSEDEIANAKDCVHDT